MDGKDNTKPVDMRNTDTRRKETNGYRTYKVGCMWSDNYVSFVRNTLPYPYQQTLIRMLPMLLPQHALPPFSLWLNLHSVYGVPDLNLKTHGGRVVYSTRQMPPLPKATVAQKIFATSSLYLLYLNFLTKSGLTQNQQISSIQTHSVRLGNRTYQGSA